MLLALLLDNLLPSNSYDLAILPAIIGAVGALGAGVAGAIGGSKSTSSANSMNYKINQMNNEFNAAEAQKSRDYMTEMWNKTNEYNSPSAMRQRLAEAGYNPYLALNSGAAGSASNVGSPATGSAAAAAPQQPYDWSNLASSISSAAQIFNQTQQSNAQVSALQGQKSLADAQTYQTLSNVDWYKLGPEYRRWLQTTGASRAALSLNTDKQQLENMQWINKIQRAQRTDILLSNEAKRIVNKYLDKSQSLQLNLMANQAFQAFSAGRLSLQQCKTEVTKQLMNMAETEGKKISNRIASETADQLIGALQWQYSSDEMFSRGFSGYARQAGAAKGKGDIATGQLSEYNYGTRYWNTAVESIGRVGNAVGLPLMFRGLGRKK